MLGHGFDASGNLAGAEVDGNDPPGSEGFLMSTSNILLDV
jgi:hypothetical protein